MLYVTLIEDSENYISILEKWNWVINIHEYICSIPDLALKAYQEERRIFNLPRIKSKKLELKH